MSNTQSTTTVRAFDEAASDFDDLGQFLWEPIGAATVEATSPSAGDHVLDACCGVGASAIPSASRVGPDGRVDAIDLSAPMIDELTSLAADLPQLHATHADATSWPTDGYDVVQCVLGIFFFPDMATGTDWLASRARPGGRVGLTIWRRGSMEAAGHHLIRAVAEVTRTDPTRRPSHPIDDVNQATDFQSWLSDADVERVCVAYLESLRAENVDHLDATTLIGLGSRPSQA
ncbi:class I SAM-dependent methyltransferase [Phytoactinopolyspora alkaliphila]|uniref:Class I SAM-dependent methyltransferase n=1 Tax=Phytoactinopolyspora alkaliphila TaxID=1783498 RepID=A0A6N9YPP0_9ACTN|nr:class I SAM-dependent methyltransferase [Phytoactinopolyspora alkaliphila]NED97016.1 class I SAM-dependent methyltransferase [Phytoactinopolyspora alkaliphila]